MDVKENVPAGTPIWSLKAVSPSNQKLIYSITDGDPYKEFTVDFNIGKQNYAIKHKIHYLLDKHYETWG